MTHRSPSDVRKRIADRLEHYSGISSAWYQAHDLKITKEDFRVELLKDRKLLLGRADARYTAPIGPKGRAEDPSVVLMKAVQTHFETYRRDILHVDFARVSAGEQIETEVRIDLKGTPTGDAAGGSSFRDAG